MRNSISHPKNDLEGIRSHNPTKLLCLSPKSKCTREISSLTGSSSHEELDRPGTLWRDHTTATPIVGNLNGWKARMKTNMYPRGQVFPNRPHLTTIHDHPIVDSSKEKSIFATIDNYRCRRGEQFLAKVGACVEAAFTLAASVRMKLTRVAVCLQEGAALHVV